MSVYVCEYVSVCVCVCVRVCLLLCRFLTAKAPLPPSNGWDGVCYLLALEGSIRWQTTVRCVAALDWPSQSGTGVACAGLCTGMYLIIAES